MLKLDIPFDETLCPVKNMQRFTATMLSIFEKYDRPFGNVTEKCDKMDSEKPNVTKKAEGTLDVLLTPIADKQGCIPLRNLSELEAGKRFSVDLDILIDDENLPKYYELQLRPESDCAREEKLLDFQTRHPTNIQSPCSNGCSCFSVSPASKSKTHFKAMQKDLHECAGNDSFPHVSPKVKQQRSEKNVNHPITPADEEAEILELNESSLSDSFNGFIDLFCRKANNSFAWPLSRTRAKFHRQQNFFSNRRRLKLAKKRLNCSNRSKFSLAKYVSTTKNWTNTPMFRRPNKTKRFCFTSLGRNEGSSDVLHFRNRDDPDKPSQTTGIQPSMYSELVNKNSANATFQYIKFHSHKNSQSPRFIYPPTPNADIYCSEQIQSPTSSSNSIFQQDFRCTCKSLGLTCKFRQTSNVNLQRKDLVCWNKARSPKSEFPQTSKVDFLVEGYDNSENTYNSVSNSLYPLSVEQEDSSRCEQADQYGLRPLQMSTQSEMNKPFMMCLFDSCKIDNVRNDEILPTLPTTMQAISSPFSSRNQPGQAMNNVANSDYEMRHILPKRLVLPFNLKNQLPFRIRDIESDFDKIYRELCVDNCSELPKFKKADLTTESSDCSDGDNYLKSSIFYKKRKAHLPNDNSLIPSAKRLRGDPSDNRPSDRLKSFFKKGVLFHQENKTPYLPMNAESHTKASKKDNHANLQLKLNYDGSQKMKDVQSFNC